MDPMVKISQIGMKVSAISVIAAAAVPLCGLLPERTKEYLPEGVKNPSTEAVATNILGQTKMGATFVVMNLAAAGFSPFLRRKKSDN